jgi:hypothetical protein
MSRPGSRVKSYNDQRCLASNRYSIFESLDAWLTTSALSAPWLRPGAEMMRHGARTCCGRPQLCPTVAPAILNDGAAGARGRHSEHLPRIEFRQYREAEGARSRSTAEPRSGKDRSRNRLFNGPALMVRSNHNGRKSTLYSTVLSGFPEVSIVHE